ncbi:Uncharacterised protein [Legionella pneumophila]|nr:Uncharacterised protein [Legionella pneumophila]CZR28053.1 conjugative coupling factor TraD [Legionella pneumophila]
MNIYRMQVQDVGIQVSVVGNTQVFMVNDTPHGDNRVYF